MTTTGPRIYVICFAARSGSNYLCDLLRGTGVLGKPAELLNPSAQEAWRLRFGLAGDAPDPVYWDALRDRAGDGWLGVKAASNLVPFADHFGRSTIRYIRLTREDTVAQAISWYRAMASGRWSLRDVPAESDAGAAQHPGPVPFDRDAILERLAEIERDNTWWVRWFEENDIEPLPISYEGLCGDPGGTVAQVASFLGESVPAGFEPATTLRIQRDDLSEEWRRRLQS